ncbi:MAG: hypothetical protein GTN49_01375 [candidate division Zixibacteria bacterium]|nr:hypothetical protein [candidate division Zixibacteria bacterium]
MADEVEQVVYEVTVEGADEAIRALNEGKPEEAKFIIVTIREVKPWRGLRQ